MNESARKYRVSENVLENVSGGGNEAGGNPDPEFTIHCPICRTSMTVKAGYHDCSKPGCKAYIYVDDNGNAQIAARTC